MTEDARCWLAARLEDLSLLDRAVAIGGDLAVPVGGERRGGYVCVGGEEEAAAVIALLASIPGFPNLRAVLSHDPEVADNVRWGGDEPPVPDMDESDLEWARWDVATGRFCGYSEKAIREYVAKQWGRRAAVEAAT
jgi:Family of unknown function (DUF6302)